MASSSLSTSLRQGIAYKVFAATTGSVDNPVVEEYRACKMHCGPAHEPGTSYIELRDAVMKMVPQPRRTFLEHQVRGPSISLPPMAVHGRIASAKTSSFHFITFPSHPTATRTSINMADTEEEILRLQARIERLRDEQVRLLATHNARLPLTTAHHDKAVESDQGNTPGHSSHVQLHSCRGKQAST